MRRFWGSLLALLLLAAPAWAQSSGSAEDLSPHSEALLASEVASVQPGEAFTVALRMTMEAGWHSYWMNPGDAGQPTRIDWALPPGFTADSIRWPHPHRIDAGPLTSYGYSDEVLLLTTITPPDDLEPGTEVQIGGDAAWLICADICLPAEAPDLRLTLPVRAEPPAPSDEWSGAFAEARAQLPRTLPNWSFEAVRSAGSYALKVTPPEDQTASLEGTHFFPSEKAVLDHAAPQPLSKEEDGSYLLALQQSEYAQAPAERLRGALVAPDGEAWGPRGDVQALWVDAPVDTAQAASAFSAETQGRSMSLVWALLFAFTGGLILNLMPCVFPVLSLKVLSFARQAGEGRAAARRHGLVFGAGVVVSFWVLAGLLLAFRAGGSQIGWGFQLQSPLFVALMAMLFFGIGLNLLGVFEVGSTLMSWGGRAEGAAAESSYGGSFLSGVLATVVATPCTAPLMGAALGFALSLSVGGALLVFTALGVGMAAPYVLLSAAPRLLRRLPKPGAWMETLRQALAFPMFAAAIWLIWVFGQQAGVSGAALLLTGLLLLSTAAWILGRWDARRLPAGWRLFTRGLAAAALAGALMLALVGARYEAPAAGSLAAQEEGAAWQPFSPEKVEQLRAEGRPVFVDFTAAWCLTCQVNERTALSTAAVQAAFDEKNVALLKADWTNRDATIARALEDHGRSGVPLYVLYKGDGSDPTLLPEILTQSIVLNALESLPGGNSQTPPDVAARSE